MPPETLILIALILFAGSALQSAAGFAFGLFAVPLLVLLGLAPFDAIATVATCAGVVSTIGFLRHRREVDWRSLTWLLLPALLTIPLGVWLLQHVTQAGEQTVRQTFGGLLLAVIALQLLIKPQPRDTVRRRWAVLAGVGSGVISGLAGMAGPPIVLWVVAHDWSVLRMRATMWTVFMCTVPLNVMMQGLRFGPTVWEHAALGLAFTPIVLLGMLPGMWIGTRMPQLHMRRLAMGLLVCIGTYALFSPLL